jgi:hypothetical protein
VKLASLDLSGNQISNVGLQLIADYLHESALRFIALKFNPCRAMPLLSSDSEWTNMPRSGLFLRQPPAESSPARPRQVCDRPTSNAPRNAGPESACSKLCQRQFLSRAQSIFDVASSSKSVPERNYLPVRSAKRFKCNAVHPE